MEFVYLGKFTTTHGIKGEIKILSNFEKKDLVLKKGFKLYFGPEKLVETINSYRPHQNYDMVTLEGLNNINDVLKYKGLKVYINKEDLNLDKKEFLLDDLIGCTIICDNKNYGVVKDIFTNKQTLLNISYEKEYYIPYVPDFIINVDILKKEIYVRRVEELL